MHTWTRTHLDTHLWAGTSEAYRVTFAFIITSPIIWKFHLSRRFEYLLWFPTAGGVPQVFLTAPSGTVQIPVSAVQLHQVGGGHPSPHANQPASHFFILTLGIQFTYWSKPRSLVRRPVFLVKPVVDRQASSGSFPWLVPLPYTSFSLQMAVIGQQAGSSSNLTELQVVNLDAAHSTKSD